MIRKFVVVGAEDVPKDLPHNAKLIMKDPELEEQLAKL